MVAIRQSEESVVAVAWTSCGSSGMLMRVEEKLNHACTRVWENGAYRSTS